MTTLLSDLTSTLYSALANLPAPENIKDEERVQLLGAIGQLQSVLETPVQIIQKHCFAVGYCRTSFITESALNLVALWNCRNQGCPGHGNL